MILDDRAANGPVENVSMEDLRACSCGRIESISGVQECVAIELACVPMESIRARPHDLVHNRTGVSAVFWIERIGDHAHFPNRIRVRRQRPRQRSIQRYVIEIRAVYKIAVLLGLAAVY